MSIFTLLISFHKKKAMHLGVRRPRKSENSLGKLSVLAHACSASTGETGATVLCARSLKLAWAAQATRGYVARPTLKTKTKQIIKRKHIGRPFCRKAFF